MASEVRVKGFTLTEVLVYCALLSIFSTIFFLSLPGRGFQSSEDIQQASQSANFALNALSSRISNSAATHIRTHEKPSGLIFLSAQVKSGAPFEYTKSGELGWLQWEGVFWEEDQLVSYSIPFEQATALTSVEKAPSWEEFSKYKRRVLVQNVRAFKYDVNKYGSWILFLEVQSGQSWQQLRTGAKPRN